MPLVPRTLDLRELNVCVPGSPGWEVSNMSCSYAVAMVRTAFTAGEKLEVNRWAAEIGRDHMSFSDSMQFCQDHIPK